MSKDVAEIDGKVESYTIDFDPKYKDVKLSLTSFWGGKKRGKSIQLTISGNYSYIELDHENTIKLYQELKKHLNL